MKKKNILFTIWSFSYGGGAEKQLANLVNSLDEKKYNIDIIEFLHTNKACLNVNENIKLLNPINNKEKESKIKRKIVNIMIYICPYLVRKKYIKKEYDYEISFNYLIPSFLLSNSKSNKKICWIHGPIWDLKEKKNSYKRFLQRKFFKRADKIVAIAEETKKSIENIYPEFKEKIEIIYNGYSFSKMDELCKEYSVERKSKLELLYCNRFDNNKNPLFLIEVAKLLSEKNIDFHINFLGNGELRYDMEMLIRKYNLNKYIDILGYKENPYPYLKSCDLICLTSKSEGFSTIMIEGMHFGKPFVSTTYAVANEVREKGCGLLADEIFEYSKCIEKLYNDTNIIEKMSKNCINYSRNFTVDNQIKKIENIFKGDN